MDITHRLREMVIERQAYSEAKKPMRVNDTMTGWLTEAAAEIERLRAAISGPVTIKNFGARTDEWLTGFQAGVEAKESAISAALVDEQNASEDSDTPDGWLPDGSWAPGG